MLFFIRTPQLYFPILPFIIIVAIFLIIYSFSVSNYTYYLISDSFCVSNYTHYLISDSIYDA